MIDLKRKERFENIGTFIVLRRKTGEGAKEMLLVEEVEEVGSVHTKLVDFTRKKLYYR